MTGGREHVRISFSRLLPELEVLPAAFLFPKADMIAFRIPSLISAILQDKPKPVHSWVSFNKSRMFLKCVFQVTVREDLNDQSS